MLVRRLVTCEVDARDLTACRLLAAFERRRGALVPVAFLAFDDDVELVHTAPTHRRRGIASALLARALEEVPSLGYSADHTADGAAWGRARGLQVPAAQTLTEDAEVAWAAASVYLYLTHTEPEELLGLRPLRRRRPRVRART
ncbi:MAG: GNAT family N-acetyltransferase [Quadrisphaera sp.]